MTRYATAVGLTAALALSAGCVRETGEAGVKNVGVGYDPGDIYRAPQPTGGVVDYALLQLRGTGLDLGATGFFLSGGAFTDATADPFDLVLGFSYFFAPRIKAADELALITPKGPDVRDTCFVQVAGSGPLGSFSTVDVGDNIAFRWVGDEEVPGSEFKLTRNPQDFPKDSSEVFSYYIGTDVLNQGSTGVLGNNWAFNRPVEMQFGGGIPPEESLLASIPIPSNAPDDRVGKADGHPSVYSPPDLGDVYVSNLADGSDSVVMRYDPTAPGLPNPLENDRVVSLRWDTSEELTDDSFVSISVKFLPHQKDGTRLESGGYCAAAEALAPVGDRDQAWLNSYASVKSNWCDPDFEPDPLVGNDESGADYLGEDTCHDGLDSDADGTCDESGCLADDGETWLLPDPDCARHSYKTAACGSDNLCRPVGGSLTGEGDVGWQTGEVLCTAEDDGEFVVDASYIAELARRLDMTQAAGAILTVARTGEKAITVPMVRDAVGKAEDINPVRLRASNAQVGRFEWQ